MANVYYGDGGVSAVDGNWNHAANWFVSLGVCCCGTGHAGTPLGRAPNAATDTVILTCGPDGGSDSSAPALISTGPTGGYAGTVKTLGGANGSAGSGGTNVTISDGVYSGTWDLTNGTDTGGLVITGGTWKGQWLVVAGLINVFVANNLKITGGNYSPAITLNQVGGVVTFTSANGVSVADPGFALGRVSSGSATITSTYTPVVTIGNMPAGGNEILGAGLP